MPKFYNEGECPESEIRWHSSAAAPRPLRCSSLEYMPVFAVVAPCGRAAASLSVLSEFLIQDTIDR
jgi:hypothetical protein